MSAYNGFHGRTYGALTATAQPKYHAGFEPMIPGFAYMPYDDLETAAAAIDDLTAAVMVEPVQGEGGVNIPSEGYLEGLRELCDKRGALLILDEVQTGLGRTGKWFAYQHTGVTPDILTWREGARRGCGVRGFAARPEVAATLKPGMHASTFGGNPIACRAGLAAVETIEEEGLLARADAIGGRFVERFEEFRTRWPGLIRDIRVRGAMIGLDLSVDATPVLSECMARRLLINVTHGSVVRLLPALTLSDAEIDAGCEILGEALASLDV